MGRLDTQATVTLVLNGKQMETSLRDVNAAIRQSRAELERMREADNPQLYQERAAALRRLIDAQREMRTEIYQSNETQNKFFADFKDGFSQINGLVGKFTLGNLISTGIEKVISGFQSLMAGSNQAYEESVRTQTQLQTVLKSTGGAAGESIDKLQDYQSALMDQTGVDDDVIAKGEEMLLTFTNVRGKIYEGALPAIMDMSAAMNGGKVSMEGIQTASIQVGKALNDPIKGITALQKVGVSFTEQQKEQVKSLVANNQMMDAQAIILKELQKEFGGTAKAIANTDVGEIQKFDTRIGNIQESIGKFNLAMEAAKDEALEPFVRLMEKATETKLSDTLQEDRAQLMASTLQLESANLSQEKRIEIINKLKAQYPEYLEKVDAEKTTNAQLIPILNKINEAMVLRIAYQKKSEGLKEALQDEADAMLRMDNSGQRLAMTMSAIMERFKGSGVNIVMPQNLTDLQQADYLLQQLNKRRKDGLAMNVNREATDLKVAMTELQQYKDMYAKAGTERQKFLDEQQRFAKQYGFDPDGKDKAQQDYIKAHPAQDPTSEASKKDKDALAKKAKEFDKAVEEARTEYLKTAQAAQKGAADSLESTIKVIEDNFRKQIAKLKDLAKAAKDPKLKAELLGDADNLEKKGGLRDQAVAKATSDFNKKQREEGLKQAAARAADKKSFEDGVEGVIGQGYNDQKAALDQAQAAELALVSTQEAQQNIKDKYREKDLQLEKTYLETLKKWRVANGRDVSDISAKIGKNDIDITADTIQKKERLRTQEYQFAKTITNGLADLIQITMGNSAMGVAMQKAVTIAQLAIDTASAISSVTAQNAKTSLTPIDYAIRVAAAVVTVLGNVAAARNALSQANDVKSTGTVKKAAKGAIVTGPSHDQGGIDLVDTVTGNVIGNMEGGEAIIPADTTRNNPKLISEMLYNSRYRNGGPMRLNSDMAVKATGTYLASAAASSSTGTGQVYRSSSTGNNTGNDMSALVDEIRALGDKINDKKVYFHLQEFNEVQRKLVKITTKANS